MTVCCLQLSCSLWGKKTKGLQSYGCHLVFVSLCFLLNVFQSLSEFWCPKSVVERIILCHQKRKRNLFFFLPVKHYMSYLNSTGDAGLGFYWTTEHMGSFKVLSLGRAMCELRTVFFLTLQCKYISIWVFKSLQHYLNIHFVFLQTHTHSRST